MYRIFLALVLSLIACDPVNISGPSPSPEPPPPEVVLGPAPPVFRGVPFSWSPTRGILVFAGTQANAHQIQILNQKLLSAGWPTPTYNVCSEVSAWESTPWSDGPPPFSKENLDNLRRFLQVTAELGSQVRLNIFCTLRDNTNWMKLNAQRYTKVIVRIVNDFDHVVISIANEPWHPSSKYLRQNANMRKVRDWIRLAGWKGLIGADDNIDSAGTSFAYTYRNLGFIPDFHPYRNPDPNGRAMDRMVAENGLPLIISEPTAYSKWRSGICCTKSKQQILDYMHRAERRGIIWFYHSTSGLIWPKETFEWIPK